MSTGVSGANQATTVLYVRRRDAKTVKVEVELANLIDKEYRIAPADIATSFDEAGCCGRCQDGKDRAVEHESGLSLSKECVAIPVLPKCLDVLRYFECDISAMATEGRPSSKWKDLVVGFGEQVCPRSSAFLGCQRQGGKRRPRSGKDEYPRGEAHNTEQNGTYSEPLSAVHEALVDNLTDLFLRQNVRPAGAVTTRDEIVAAVRSLPHNVCPNKIERIGDDDTLVIPRTALTFNDSAFMALFGKVLDDGNGGCISPERALLPLWSKLADIHGSTRVVRRGDVSPDSKVRESGHRILWPNVDDAIEAGVPRQTGPGSPGWISVTEYGIKQSFDLTRVMFSRGNVTEKKRFGELVREDEIVLDMYAGIGYYTLPALIHGKAKHVYACEWNPHAASALHHNLRENGVCGRATVIVGDSRLTTDREEIVGRIDRVSLGLLPSSEGGWPTAVRSLNETRGGWLHIHGNVPIAERVDWALWLCRNISSLAKELGRTGWSAICVNIEKVKSFAPRVDHNVADVFVGPNANLCFGDDVQNGAVGLLQTDKTLLHSPDAMDAPSCALGCGVLNQRWMIES